MPRWDRTSGLAELSAHQRRNEMFAPAVSSQHHQGVIRVVRETDGIVAVCVKGEFDMANAPTLGDQVDLALETGHDLIVDLSKATFIDSSVISVLMRAVRAAREREQTMVLQLGTAAIVERILEIVKIEQVLPRAHDRQEAVRIIQEKAAQLENQ